MLQVNKRRRRLLYNRKWIAAKRLSRQQLSETDEPDKDESSGESGDEHSLAQDGTDSAIGHNETMNSYQDTYISNGRIVQSMCDQDEPETSSFMHVSSSSESDDNSKSLVDSLRVWANTFEVKANAVDNLLKILKESGHPDIPACARTLLKTPRSIEVLRVSNMDYFHFGLNEMLCITLKRLPEACFQNLDTLMLILNVDGFPLFKSTNYAVWPILGMMCNIKPAIPFPIAVTVGKSKPSNLDFLEETITELGRLLADGLEFNGKHYKVELKCVTSDAPARAFIKCTKQYSGYYGCDKCNQRGLYIGRITYPCIQNLVLRSNQSFRNVDQEGHHKGRSPFENLPMDMVYDFPIDYMHQGCLGVMKKLLITWMRGPLGNNKLSAGQIAQISEKLNYLRQFIPCEFARKPRNLEEVDRWKATEFRQFLLYTGQIALKHILQNHLYNHFMCLCVAMNILVNEKLAFKYADYAQNLLDYFVKKCREFYGREFLVYNIHALLHLQKEVEKFGSLDACAAWKFENFMHQLKRKVRCGNNPAAQLVKRIYESCDVKKVPNQERDISCKSPNNVYRTQRGKYCEVIQQANAPEKSYLCRVYHGQESAYTVPCNSDVIGHVQFRNINYDITLLKADTLVTRCMKIDLCQDNKSVFLSLHHDF